MASAALPPAFCSAVADRLLQARGGILHVGGLEPDEVALDRVVVALDHLTGIGVYVVVGELAVAAQHHDLVIRLAAPGLEIRLERPARSLALGRVEGLGQGDLDVLKTLVLALPVPLRAMGGFHGAARGGRGARCWRGRTRLGRREAGEKEEGREGKGDPGHVVS